MKRKGYRKEQENCFENWLRQNKMLYLPVNEGRRTMYNGKSLKSFDVLVSSRFFLDVKGKSFPYSKSNYWENHVSMDDIKSLMAWQKISNRSVKSSTYVSILCFVYKLPRKSEDLQRAIQELRKCPSFKMDCLCYKDGTAAKNLTSTRQLYAVFAVEISDYNKYKKRRSAKWDAWYVSRDKFRKIAVPLKSIFDKYKN